MINMVEFICRDMDISNEALFGVADPAEIGTGEGSESRRLMEIMVSPMSGE